MENNEIMPEVAEPIVEEAVIQEAKPKKSFKDLLTNKKVWLAAGAAVVAVIVIVALLVTLLGSTYKSPIKDTVKTLSAKKFTDPYSQAADHLNGFAASEFKAIAKIMKTSEKYADILDDEKDDFEDSLDDMQDDYGKNFKISYKILDKDKLEKEELKETEDAIQSAGRKLSTFVEQTKDEDFDWGAYADGLGLSKDTAKKLVGKMEKFAYALKKGNVQAGYEVDVEYILKGSELKSPLKQDDTVTVYKVNGDWVTYEAIGAAIEMIPASSSASSD